MNKNICPKCGGKVLIKKTKTRRSFYVCENNTNSEDSKCDYISWTKPGTEIVENESKKVAKKQVTKKRKTTKKSKK